MCGVGVGGLVGENQRRDGEKDKNMEKEEELSFECAGGYQNQHAAGFCNCAPLSYFSPSELCGDGRREESFLLVCGSLRPKQPAGSSVQGHSLEKVGKFHMCKASVLGRFHDPFPIPIWR